MDDAGNIMVMWDCGSSLSIANGADKCHRLAAETEAKETLDHIGKSQHSPSKWAIRCPRCGKTVDKRNRLLALSRRASIMICEMCGIEEALEDAGLTGKKLCMLDWAAIWEDRNR